MTISNESGYFNEFDPSDNYYEVRAIAGRVEQSREDNEAQAIQSHKIKKLGDTLFKNGQLVRGGAFTHGAVDPKVLSMAQGEVWFNGTIHEVPATQLTLVGSGEETVGVVFTETLVTYLDDVNLRDPATGYPNAGLPGANRLRITKTWAVNNPLAVPIYIFRDGQLAKLPDSQVDLITQTLARRTFDESGNYTVSGFDVTVEAKDSGQFYAVVGNTTTGASSSKAYVQGYEIVKLLPERVPVDKGFESRSFNLDEVQYSGSSSNVTINGTVYNSGYLLRVAENRVKQLTSVKAEFRINNKVVTHSGIGSVETFINNGEFLSEIYGVKNTSGGSIAYTSPADYIKSGNAISWAPAGSEPSVGALYYVDYRYKKDLIIGTDCTLVVDSTTGASYLDITNLSPKPDLTNGPSAIDVSYDYYLDRIDVLYLRPDGKIEVVKGQADKSPAAKSVPVGMLGLCEISVPAGTGAEAAKVSKYNNRRYTMEDITGILTRLDRAEYNSAIRDLDATAQIYAGASITTLAGILTEGFRYTAEDHTRDGLDNIVRVKYDKSVTDDRIIDIPEQEMVLPEVQLTSNPAILTGSTTGRKWANSVSLATSSESQIETAQLLATGALKVNPYGTGATFPIIFISPVLDNEAESDTVIASTLALSDVTPLTFTRDQFPSAPLEADKDNNLRQFTNTLRGFIKSGKVVHVRGYGYAPNSYVQAYFDNIKVDLTAVTSSSGLPVGITLPTGGNTTGSVDGKVICNASGEFLATFVTPLGVPLGTRAVVVSDAAGRSASNTFEGRGITKAVARTLTSAPGVVPTPSSSQTSTKDSEVAKVAEPKFLTFTPPTDISGGAATVTFAGTFTGLVNNIVVLLGNGTKEVFPIAATTTSFSVTTSAAVGAATTYEVYLSSDAGGRSESKTGEIKFNSAVPAGIEPVVTSWSTYISNSGSRSWTVNISWSTTGASKVTFHYTCATGVTTSVNMENAPLSGQATFVFTQRGTLTMTAHSGSKTSAPKTFSASPSKPKENGRVDPLAQTFTITKATAVTGVDVYFKTKSTTSPVICQLRSVVNGYPGPGGTDVIASKQLLPSEVNISADGSAVTTFTFDDPAWLTVDDNKKFREYCFVLLSDSVSYEVYVAKVGELTIATTPELVTTQPYLDGVAFVSTNDTAWSALQDTDLKFRVKTATFDQVSGNLLVLQSISTSNCTGMFLKVDATGLDSYNYVTWQYQLNNNSGWLAFEPGTYVNFGVVASQIDIRATITGTNLTSPVIHTNTLSMKLLFRQSSGEYVSKRATYQVAYNKVRLITRAYVPSQCTMKIYFTDETSGAGPGGFTWTEITSWPSVTTLPDNKYLEKDNVSLTLSPSNSTTRKFFRFRIRLETTDLTLTPRVRDIMSIVNNA